MVHLLGQSVTVTQVCLGAVYVLFPLVNCVGDGQYVLYAVTVSVTQAGLVVFPQ